MSESLYLLFVSPVVLAGLPYTPPAQLGHDYMAAEAAVCHQLCFSFVFHMLCLSLRAGMPYTPPAQLGPDYMAAEAESLSAGQRCCVEPGERRGEIK
jgi:hypothetical protein